MTTWKIIRIYKIQANTKREALAMFHSAEYTGAEPELLEMEFAKEDQGKGLLTVILKQVLG